MPAKARLKLIHSLTTKKGRRKHSLFLAEGMRVCSELLESSFIVEEFLYTKSLNESRRGRRLISGWRDKGVLTEPLADLEMNAITNTVQHQGCLAVARIPEEKPLDDECEGWRFVVALSEISDPGNLGTIIRTSAWFGADALLLSPGSADPFNPKVVRSSAGALFHIPVYRQKPLDDAIESLTESGFESVAAVTHEGENINNFTFPEKCLIVFGSEAEGLPDRIAKNANHRISIPRHGRVESLNLAVSVGIILSAFRDYRGFPEN